MSQGAGGRYQIGCMNVSDDYALVFFTKMAEILKTHLHVHHTDIHDTIHWHPNDTMWHGMT